MVLFLGSYPLVEWLFLGVGRPEEVATPQGVSV